MTDIVLPGWDITAANYDSRPSSGQAMLYGTGTPDIKATPAMIAENPWCVLVDQSPVVGQYETSMDVFDMENGAMTLTELGDAIHWAVNDRVKHVRAGQRVPLVYASDSRMPDVIRVLTAARLQGMCGLFVAHWGVSDQDATQRILGSAGSSFPVMAMQNLNTSAFDRDLFSRNWLATSGQWNYSWTREHQQWTLNELASKLGIDVPDLHPGNGIAATVVYQWEHGQQMLIIPPGAHFTYRKYPAA